MPLLSLDKTPGGHRATGRAPGRTAIVLAAAVLASFVPFAISASPAAAAAGPSSAQSVRPFPAPDTVRTAWISTNIDATGSTDVRAALAAAIAAVPDRSVIEFPANAVYRIDSSLRIGDRHDLVFQGNGTTLRMGSSDWSQTSSVIDIFAASSDIVIRDFKLKGNSPKPGTLIDGHEFANGIQIDIASRIEIDHVTIRAVYGDALCIDNWAHAIWFHDSRVVSAGRSGIDILAARNVTVERNTFDKVGLHGFNIEPYRASGGGVKIRFLDNTIGDYGSPGSDAGKWAVMFAAVGAPGSTVQTVIVNGNRVLKRSLQSIITSPTRRQDIRITNNSSAVAQAPYYNNPGVLTFAHVDGVTVSGNVQPLTSGNLVSVSDCTGVQT